MDTICTGMCAKLKPEVSTALNKALAWKDELAGWRFRTGCSPPHGMGDPVSGFVGTHEPTGTVVKGKNNTILQVTASLPRILFGTNSICIRYNQQNCAVLRLNELLEVISGRQEAPWNLHRWDFAIQLRCDVARVIAAYRNARTLRVLGSATQYLELGSRKGHGLQWTGKCVTIKLYDKGKQINSTTRGPRVQEGVVLRVEVSLKNKQSVAQHLPVGATRRYHPLPDYFTGWRIFREIVTSLEPKVICDAGDYKHATAFAYAEHKGYTAPDGGSYFDWWARGKNSQTVQRMRREMQAFILQFSDWSFERVLPRGHPPYLVDILADGSLIDVPTPFAS